MFFQMVTTIDGRLADIVLVQTDTADDLLATSRQPAPGSFEALFAQKMRTALILYDASQRLKEVKNLVNGERWNIQTSDTDQDSDAYAAWFWQSFGLLHLERMAKSQNLDYLIAVDMMLTACLSGTWRSYFDLRRKPWEGEKAAMRYWAEYDTEYLKSVRECLECHERQAKLAAYRKLVEQTISPIGEPLAQGQTAVILGSGNNRQDLQRTLEYWESLLGGKQG